MSTTEKNAIVAIYPSHVEAEAAVNELKRSGVDIKKLSIVGSVHTREQVIGSYTAGDRIRHWGESGVFWGGVGGLFLGAALFAIPGLGPMVVAGPLLTEVACALEGAVVAGGLSALGAGLYSLGLPKDRVIRYETAIKDGKFVLIAHGTPEEVADARAIIQRTGPESSEPHRA